MSQKISQMTNGNPAQSGDLIPIARSGANFKVTASSIAALAGGGFSTPGVAQFYGAGILQPYGQGIVAGKVGVVAQGVYVYQFVLQNSWVIQTASYLSENGGSNLYFGFGIYDLAGNALLRTSFLSTNISGNTNQTNTFSPVTLPTGTYYFAQSVDSQALVSPVFSLTYSGQSPDNLFSMINANQNVACLAANSMSVGTGVMPATLGVLTPLISGGSGGNVGIAVVKFTP